MHKRAKRESEQLHEIQTSIVNGKDELNFAEFPLGVLSTRIPEGQKSLSFKRNVIDQETGKPIVRELRITAPPDTTLPTATDDEVTLALIQLSKQQNFATRKVYFTRYHLLRILKWKRNGQNYRRLSESLDRLCRVDYRYFNAWFDKTDNRWKNAVFSILDAVVIDPKENEKSKPKFDVNQRTFEFASSWFSWSEMVHESFQAGFMKSLNYDFATNLKSKVTLRLFRFLDKRFWHNSRLEFGLRQLGYEHIGISRNSLIKHVKLEVKKAIRELEEKGYITMMPENERFVKLRVGEWRVVFEKAELSQPSNRKSKNSSSQKQALPTKKKVIQSRIYVELTKRGISDKQAKKIEKEYNAEFLHEKINQFDFVVKSDTEIKNPQGYLYSSITDTSWNNPPKGYKTPAEQEKEEQRKEQRKRERDSLKEASKKQKDSDEAKEEARVNAFWQSLNGKEKEQALEEALRKANSNQEKWLKAGGIVGESAKINLMDEYALSQLV